MLEIFKFITKVKAQGGNLPNITPPKPPTSIFDSSGLVGIVTAVLTLVLELAAGLLVIAVLYSGILYITSGGDTTKAETAKKNLIWAITGLVIMLLLNFIIYWVQYILTNKA